MDEGGGNSDRSVGTRWTDLHYWDEGAREKIGDIKTETVDVERKEGKKKKKKVVGRPEAAELASSSASFSNIKTPDSGETSNAIADISKVSLAKKSASKVKEGKKSREKSPGVHEAHTIKPHAPDKSLSSRDNFAKKEAKIVHRANPEDPELGTVTQNPTVGEERKPSMPSHSFGRVHGLAYHEKDVNTATELSAKLDVSNIQKKKEKKKSVSDMLPITESKDRRGHGNNVGISGGGKSGGSGRRSRETQFYSLKDIGGRLFRSMVAWVICGISFLVVLAAVAVLLGVRDAHVGITSKVTVPEGMVHDLRLLRVELERRFDHLRRQSALMQYAGDLSGPLMVEIDSVMPNSIASSSNGESSLRVWRNKDASDGQLIDREYVSGMVERIWRLERGKSGAVEDHAALEARGALTDRKLAEKYDDERQNRYFRILVTRFVSAEDVDQIRETSQWLASFATAEGRPCAQAEDREQTVELVILVHSQYESTEISLMLDRLSGDAAHAQIPGCIVSVDVRYQRRPVEVSESQIRAMYVEQILTLASTGDVTNTLPVITARYLVLLDSWTWPLMPRWVDRLAESILKTRNGDFCILGALPPSLSLRDVEVQDRERSIGTDSFGSFIGRAGDDLSGSSSKIAGPESDYGAEVGLDGVRVPDWTFQEARRRRDAALASMMVASETAAHGGMESLFLSAASTIRIRGNTCGDWGSGWSKVESVESRFARRLLEAPAAEFRRLRPRALYSDVVLNLADLAPSSRAATDIMALRESLWRLHWDSVFLRSPFPFSNGDGPSALIVASESIDAESQLPLMQLASKLAAGGVQVTLAVQDSSELNLRLFRDILGVAQVVGYMELSPAVLRSLVKMSSDPQLFIVGQRAVAQSLGALLLPQLLGSRKKATRAIYLDDEVIPRGLPSSIGLVLCRGGEAVCGTEADYLPGVVREALNPSLVAGNGFPNSNSNPSATGTPLSSHSKEPGSFSAPGSTSASPVPPTARLRLIVLDDSLEEEDAVKLATAIELVVDTVKPVVEIHGEARQALAEAAGANLMRKWESEEIVQELPSVGPAVAVCIACLEKITQMLPRSSATHPAISLLLDGTPVVAPRGSASLLSIPCGVQSFKTSQLRRRAALIEFGSSHELSHILRELASKPSLVRLAALAAPSHYAPPGALSHAALLQSLPEAFRSFLPPS